MKYVKKAGYIVATIIFLVFTLGPFVWTFVMAITPKAEMFSNVVSLLPSHITWSNFQNLFSGGRRSVAYFTGLKNSLRAVIVTICIGMPIALVSAYTLSRMEFLGRKIIKNALLITMVIPVMATIIPLYKMFSAGHMLDNTFWLSMVYVSSYLPMATWMIIGGVQIPYEKGLLGHSDADVLLHAIMDALLGAAALGDIGKHFPDTDSKYKGISSIKLLEYVRELIDDELYVVGNIDATIIAQRPKMAPYIEQMKKNVADALAIEVSQVNIKATTEEGLGFTGSGEGISAQAIASLETIVNYSYGVGPADVSSGCAGSCGGCTGCSGCQNP